MFFEAKEIMAKASMPLAKWTSNSQVVSDKIYQEISAKPLIPGESIKVLGTKWITKNDTFSFDGVKVLNDIITIKHIVLSSIVRLFDPLVLLNPFIMQIKILFQEIWYLGLEWDNRLPEEYQSKFLTWVRDIGLLKIWEIPRCYFQGVPWNGLTNVELLVFCDASEQGYGANVYIGVRKGSNIF